MAEALLERMASGTWGGGGLVKELRAHLRPLIDLQKENDDVYVSQRHATLLSVPQ